MKKTTLFFTAILCFLFFSFGSIYSTSKERIIFEHIENVDEMEDTPEEIYIAINGHLYMVDTETNESKLIY